MAGLPPVRPGEPPRLVPAYGLYYLDNQPLVLRAGSVPYWSVPPQEWAERLQRQRDAGCNAVLATVPWRWHAPTMGQADLAGATHPQRDLGAYLHLAQREGLVAFLRPGPAAPSAERVHAGVSPSGAGYPPWLAKAIPQALARGPDGSPAARPQGQVFSLLHEAYLARVEEWYGQVAATVRPLQNRPVVSWHLDRQAGLPFRGRIGELDFNPHTVARYRAFLEGRYENAGVLAREWRRDVAGFGLVLPPRDRRSHGELADWQAFLEAWVAEYLERLRGLARRLDITVPLATDDPADYASPQNPRLKGGVVDLFGYDLYADDPDASDAGAPPAASRGDDPRRGSRGVPSATPGTHSPGPFAGSQGALRFEPFSAVDRPLTCWLAGPFAGPARGGEGTSHLATLHDLVGGLAHGVKGYGIPFEGAPGGSALPAAEAALVRLQRWLESAGEELTASVEVRDALAYLDYPPYSRLVPDDFPAPRGRWPGSPPPAVPRDRRARYGLHALLLTCGYNPSIVDLQDVPDAELAEFPAAVFPSLGYLAVEDYGKLVVFTLRGGTLVTLPQPATRQPDGTSLNTRFLWPHQADDVEFLAPGVGDVPSVRRWAGRLLGHVIGRARAGGAPPGSRLRTAWGGTGRGPDGLDSDGLGSDGLDPDGRLLTFPGAGQPVVRYGRRGAGEVPRAATETFQAQVLLEHGPLPAAYRVQVRSGTSTVVGTWLGGAYATPRYALLAPETRLALRRFALGLFAEAVPRQVVPQERLELETIVRLSPDGGCLLFVVNRLGAQSGWIHFPSPAALNLADDLRAEVLFSAAGSQVVAGTGAVRLDVRAGDALVVRLH